MSVHTPMLPTDATCTLVFVGPADAAPRARDALHALGFTETPESIPWRDAFPAWSEAHLPGAALAGARHKEGLTQRQLAQMVGIPQRHISEMEHGKRPIGKARARQLATVLRIDYHVLL